MESLALDCPLSLEEFCDEMQRRFSLPAFEFGSENETEWGLVQHEGIEYNVSRPYEPGTLQEWDDTVPNGCNFGLTLLVFEDCPFARGAEWSSTTFASQIGQATADLFGRPVHYHRSRVQGGSNVTRTEIFRPSSRHDDQK